MSKTFTILTILFMVMVAAAVSFAQVSGSGNYGISGVVTPGNRVRRSGDIMTGDLDMSGGVLSNTSTTNGGDLPTNETLRNTSTSTGFTIRSANTAANTGAGGADAAIIVRPVNALDANDNIIVFQNSAGTTRFAIEEDGSTTAQSGIIIGGGGNISRSDNTATTIDFGSLTAPNCADSSNITQTGAATTAACVVGPPATASPAGSVYTCIVTAADVAIVRHCCVVGTCDPASGTFTVMTFNR